MAQTLSAACKTADSEEVTAGVTRISHRIVNSYLISNPKTGRWVLVDAGLPTSAKRIIEAAAGRFGSHSEPSAILLTHGHFDHVGALETLLSTWQVPVYAHPLEFPYLAGKSPYPPSDPAVGGGLMSVMSRVFSRGPINISHRLQPLPDGGAVPFLPDWRWLHTPGHSPGHVSFYSESEKALVAGDAIVTTRQESATAVLAQKVELNGPPAYFTPDWRAPRQSVRLIASLAPEFAATGHGIPMRGDLLRKQLNALALRFEELAMPRRGRYVREPAVMDQSGVVSVPPALPRIWPRYALGAIGVTAVVLGTAALVQKYRSSRSDTL